MSPEGTVGFVPVAEIDSAEIQDAADALHEALARVMGSAPSWVIDEADWEYTDEDLVRDAFLSLNRYGRWRLTGESDFFCLRPGLDAGRASADQMADAAGYLSPDYDYVDGWTIPDDEKTGLRRALAGYVSQRRREPSWDRG
jgi:hypothetical protein